MDEIKDIRNIMRKENANKFKSKALQDVHLTHYVYDTMFSKYERTYTQDVNRSNDCIKMNERQNL